MKFLVALVAAANAASYTVCQFTQTFHPVADTVCGEYTASTLIEV